MLQKHLQDSKSQRNLMKRKKDVALHDIRQEISYTLDSENSSGEEEFDGLHLDHIERMESHVGAGSSQGPTLGVKGGISRSSSVKDTTKSSSREEDDHASTSAPRRRNEERSRNSKGKNVTSENLSDDSDGSDDSDESGDGTDKGNNGSRGDHSYSGESSGRYKSVDEQMQSLGLRGIQQVPLGYSYRSSNDNRIAHELAYSPRQELSGRHGHFDEYLDYSRNRHHDHTSSTTSGIGYHGTNYGSSGGSSGYHGYDYSSGASGAGYRAHHYGSSDSAGSSSGYRGFGYYLYHDDSLSSAYPFHSTTYNAPNQPSQPQGEQFGSSRFAYPYGLYHHQHDSHRSDTDDFVPPRHSTCDISSTLGKIRLRNGFHLTLERQKVREMADQIKPFSPAPPFDYELYEGDPDRLTTVDATPSLPDSYIDPASLNLKYRIGHGPFGDVWLATHHQSASDYDEYHEVAVKMLHPIKDDSVNEFFSKFEELWIKSKSQQLRGVCWLHGISVISGKICIALKPYEGSIGDRMARLKGGKLPLSNILRYAIELAKGVQQLHQIGFLILNLKPTNFLLDQNDHVVLGDFGIPYLLLGIPWSDSNLAFRLGTPNYMAPEQWEPGVRGPMSYETDSWGFTCSMIEMLTGTPPWFGRSVEEIYNAVVISQEKPQVPIGLPPAVENVLRGCFDSRNAVYSDGVWSGLGSNIYVDKSYSTGCTTWFLSKDHLQVGDTVRPRKPLNASKPLSLSVTEGIVVGNEKDDNQDGFVLVQIPNRHNHLRLNALSLERVTSGFASGDWVRLVKDNKHHSSLGILHSMHHDKSVVVGFLGLETLWRGHLSELKLVEPFLIGEFVRLKANITTPQFEWPHKRKGSWASGKISKILPNGCLVVRFPGKFVLGKESNCFLANPEEVERVSFDTCQGIVEKYEHVEDFHWAVRPIGIALGLFTATKVGIFVGRNVGGRLNKGKRIQKKNDVCNEEGLLCFEIVMKFDLWKERVSLLLVQIGTLSEIVSENISSGGNYGLWRQEQRSGAARLKKQLKARWAMQKLIDEQLNGFRAHYNRAMGPIMISDVSQLLMPKWAPAHELAAVSWLGDWRPSTILELLRSLAHSLFDPVRVEQALNQLINDIRIEEAVIDEEMIEIQANCILHLPFGPVNNEENGPALACVRSEFKKIHRVYVKAQHLRMKALELAVKKVLSQNDAAEFLVAFVGIQEAIHQFAMKYKTRKGPVCIKEL
ncbi:hypothetical protein BUALT_Bualt07G0128600 [Buddleja alternifolia]|uniref:Protein kinase domain-containing protein n=1 Tax=Buddleja alternifolia TaxID=168488 RepID=A0AAV6XAB8_9LAMI|nr:hypothetical protein BUALT_Bualt07G0128600 [Buddleja alternifolia]